MNQPDTSGKPIRVKVMTTIPVPTFLHQVPGGVPAWGRCRFSFDPNERDYDWLVVYDDLSAKHGEGRSKRFERLACPREHTLLTTSEPSTIKHYGVGYTAQFGHVLTSQAEWALPHPGRIYSQAGLHWFYGLGKEKTRAFEDMVAHPPIAKQADLSMVFSAKKMRHTLHQRRYNFMRYLMEHMPEMTVYGRGVRPLDDKAESLDGFRYSIAIENYIGPHHWTEKLADAFLGLTLPFYAGCTNADAYFPPESFIAIDINDPAGAVATIRAAIASREFEKRLPHIEEARRRVLYEYNFFPLIAHTIERLDDGRDHPRGDYGVIYSRHGLRRQGPVNGLRDLYGKARALYAHHVLRRN